jgi:dephospho-CoA kinase
MIVGLMGVTGSGRTTVGKVLATELGWRFYNADDYHPAANIEKMHRGQTWLRLAGRHVPAIYGPSVDVKWDEADPTYSLEAADRGA